MRRTIKTSPLISFSSVCSPYCFYMMKRRRKRDGGYFFVSDLYTGARQRLLKYVWMMSVSHAFCVLLLVSLSYARSLALSLHTTSACIFLYFSFFCYRITHSLCENFPLGAGAHTASSSAPHISSHRSFIDLTSFYSFLISLFRGGGSPSFHLPLLRPARAIHPLPART